MGSRSKELHPLRNDLGAIAFAAVVARFVFTRTQPPFHVDLPPLPQILVAGLGQLAVHHDPVPVDTLLTVAGFVGETFVSGNREAHDWLPVGGQVAQFEVLTEISNDSGSIQ